MMNKRIKGGFCLALALALLLTGVALAGRTSGESEALHMAHYYLDYVPFSYEHLIEQLEFEGFSHEEAVYAAGNCDADWNEQAEKKAKQYLDFMAFSYLGLIEQLEYEKFTPEQAAYGADHCGVDHCGADWNEQAVKSAMGFLEYVPLSYSGLIAQLEYVKFTPEQAAYGADNCGADWNEQAVKSAESYLSLTSFSRGDLIDQLEYDGFTHEQASYGAKENGY